MNNKIPFIVIAALCAFFVFLQTVSLRAQTPTPPTLREVLDDLASAPEPAAITTLGGAMAFSASPPTPPDTLFALPDTNPLGQLHRGTVLYAAAGRARELRKPGLARTLALAAKDWLLEAATGLTGAPASASRCQYYLGLIAESYEGNLTQAAEYFQTAVTLDENNTQAARALTRIQAIIQPAA
jgi:hypothetical protein